MEEATPHSLRLSWVVTEGEFDSFEVQYTDRDGKLKVVSTEGDQSDVILTGLESDHRYLVTLYGFHDGHRVDSAQIEALTGKWETNPDLLNSCKGPESSRFSWSPSLSMFSAVGGGGAHRATHRDAQAQATLGGADCDRRHP